MAEIPIAYKVFVSGGQAAEQEFRRLKQELDSGKITWDQYQRQTREVDKGLRAVQNQANQTRRTFDALHPNVNSLSRVMSGFGSVSRGIISVQNAMNLTLIANKDNSSELAQAQADVKQAQREYNAALKEFGEASPEAEDALDKLNMAMDEQERVLKRLKEEEINKYFTMASGIGILGSTTISAASEIARSGFTDKLSGLTSALGKLGGGNAARALGGMAAIGGGAALLATGGIDALVGKSGELEDKLKAIGGIGLIGAGIALEFPAIAKIALIGTAIATATVAIILFRDEIGTFFADVAKFLEPAGAALSQFFLEDVPAWGSEALGWLINVFGKGWDIMWSTVKTTGEIIWNAIQQAFDGFWKGLTDLAVEGSQAIVNAVTGMVDSIISRVQDALSWLSRLAEQVGASAHNFFNPSSLSMPPTIPAIPAAKGLHTIANGPMLILAGEAGPERIDIDPLGSSNNNSGLDYIGNSGGRSAGSTTIINNYVTVQGSVIEERRLHKIMDGYHELELRRRGFNAPM